VVIGNSGRILLAFLAVVVAWMHSAKAQDTKRIAIVRDGDSEFFDGLVQGFETELGDLAKDRYAFELLHEFNAKGSASGVVAQLRKALNDPRVDVVYTAGIVASAKAQDLPAALRTKPVVAQCH
jgi:ABC-type uncharacterized transport system substrate-binding protein